MSSFDEEPQGVDEHEFERQVAEQQDDGKDGGSTGGDVGVNLN
jgi:hypothetical protein